MGDGEVRGMGPVPTLRRAYQWIRRMQRWLLNRMEGFNGRERRPAALKLQTREKQRGP